MIKHLVKLSLFILAAGFLLSSCVDLSHKPSSLPEGLQSADLVTRNYELRTWYPPNKLDFNPIGLAKVAEVPINNARTKIIGPSYEDALDSLAAKIWMIENASYTIDMVYYIFKRDTAAYAILGALCNAVKRGVDIRIMVDSVGSMHATHNELRGLETCALEAGFMLDKNGQPTGKKARVQTVIVNALSKIFVRMNRRAHDKLIIVDGHVPQRAILITGGRNLSVSYFGIHDDGTPDPTAYQDLELILRPSAEGKKEDDSVADVSTYYYSMLFLHSGNKRLRPILADKENPEEYPGDEEIYQREREKAQERLVFVKNLPGIKASLNKMPAFLNEGYRTSWVRLAHEIGNLTNPRAVSDVRQNLERNPNSIQTILYTTGSEGKALKHLRVISPYFFVARYYDAEGKVIFDGVEEVHKWLQENPDGILELIVNSVLTSDNFMAQAIIDMDTAPRLLLSPDLLKKWLSGLKKGELNPELVDSAEWKKMIANPRIKIYQTGKIDSVELGGDQHYGKLHAKFIAADGFGFIGTTNFDYRSRLFNNEFGFYFKDDELYQDLGIVFEQLKSRSYLWGSEEWLEMRKHLMQQKGIKASTTRKQRGIFKIMRVTGIDWLI
jgi:phosphatidylserine/phosphatidylglycerophosphate/cardiolipin synthase-like enzyme